MGKIFYNHLLSCLLLIPLSFIMISCSDDDDDNIGNVNVSSSEEFENLVLDNVKCQVSFNDYFWDITIESTLSDALGGASIEYEVGHGNKYSDECATINSSDKLATRNVSTNGKTTTIKIHHPFYFYQISQGISPVSNFYLPSYVALKNKQAAGEKLTSSEIALRNDIKETLDDELYDARNAAIGVFVTAKKQSVCIGKYELR
ncbi:MAG: hypothetical protein NC349_03955 [Paenibacillus sp.]|nr:hypothetical protein [Paenibacillus sp.]